MIELDCIAFVSSDLHVLVAVGGSSEVELIIKVLVKSVVAFPCPLGVG